MIIKETGGFESWRTGRDHPNYSIVENSLNTEKSPRDLRRLAVTQTPGNADVKNSNEQVIMMIIIIIFLWNDQCLTIKTNSTCTLKSVLENKTQNS